jgi:hypothetical protein
MGQAGRERVSGGEVMTFAPVETAAPTAEQLAEYPGAYDSDELTVTYTVTACDGSLVLRRRKFPDSPLRPTITDQFISEDRLQIASSRSPFARVARARVHRRASAG